MIMSGTRYSYSILSRIAGTHYLCAGMVQGPDSEIAAVHSGILASAAALNHDLEDHGILSALLTGAAVDDQAKAQHTAAQPVAQQADDFDAAVAALAASPQTATLPEQQPAEDPRSPERTASTASHALERTSQLAGQDAGMGGVAEAGPGQSIDPAVLSAAERTDAGSSAAQGGQGAVGSSPFAHSSVQTESITAAPEKLLNGGTAAKQEGTQVCHCQLPPNDSLSILITQVHITSGCR